MKRTIFSDGYNLLNELFDCNLTELPNTVREFLVFFLSQICRYEEEETKIKPSLLVGINLERYITTPETKLFVLVRNEVCNEKTRSNLKSLVPLCNNGWTVFINYKKEEEILEYGIVRDFGGLSSLNFVDLLFYENGEKIQVIYFSVLSNNEILIKSDCIEDKIIDTRFSTQKDVANRDAMIDNLCRDCLMYYQNNPLIYQPLINTLKKLFCTIQERLHGCILVIIDSSSKIEDLELLKKDSKILDKPIDIISYAEPLLNLEGQNITSVQEYYAITGLLTSFMNTDGICVVDNSFSIRAYNSFIEINSDNLPGGARTRAFETIKSRKDINIVGCYFQSQDGYFDYWRNVNYVRQ